MHISMFWSWEMEPGQISGNFPCWADSLSLFAPAMGIVGVLLVMTVLQTITGTSYLLNISLPFVHALHIVATSGLVLLLYI